MKSLASTRFLFATVICMTCGVANGAGASDTLNAKIDAVVYQAIANGSFVGAVVLIARGCEIIYRR